MSFPASNISTTLPQGSGSSAECLGASSLSFSSLRSKHAEASPTTIGGTDAVQHIYE